MIKFEPIYTCSVDALADEINKNIKIHSYTYIKIALIDFMSDHNFFDKQSVWEESINTTEKDEQIFKEIYRMMDEEEIPERLIVI